MKKHLFFIGMLLLGFVGHAQGDLRIGINAGIPVGDIEEISSFHLGADASYLFQVGEGFSVGPMLGYSHFFGKDLDTGFGDVEVDDFSFLPIAASGRLGFDMFFLGADLGYALGITDGVDGGFYYRPKVGYNLGGLAIILSYSGISVDGGSYSALSGGIEFGL